MIKLKWTKLDRGLYSARISPALTAFVSEYSPGICTARITAKIAGIEKPQVIWRSVNNPTMKAAKIAAQVWINNNYKGGE